MNLMFNGIEISTPVSFTPNLATTSTEDSDRTQDLVMHNTPMGTIESYNVEYKDITLSVAAEILQQIINKQEYSFTYPSAYTGKLQTNPFYTTTISIGSLKKANGKDVWEKLSFNAIGVNPI